MSTRKLQGGSESPVTRLKELWRDTLSEAQRDYWRSLFLSKSTQAQIREQIRTELGIHLKHDEQLTRFRDWEFEQQKIELEAERMEDDERRILEQNPEWTKDQVREELIKRAYLRARASGDFKLGFAAMKQDRDFIETGLAERRVKMLEQKITNAQKVIEEAKKASTGGLTPETLEKIERELKLL